MQIIHLPTDARAPAPARGGRFSQIEEGIVDEVEEASKDSFPASDSPSWTPIVGIVARSIDMPEPRDRNDDEHDQRS